MKLVFMLFISLRDHFLTPSFPLKQDHSFSCFPVSCCKAAHTGEGVAVRLFCGLVLSKGWGHESRARAVQAYLRHLYAGA